MLRLKDNTFVKNAHLLECAYEVKDGEIRANVSSPYILDLSLRFLHLNKDKALSFFLETPDGLKRELDTSSDSTPKNPPVSFRIDFESFEKASGLLFFFSDLLARDGLSRFKFMTDDGDEICSEKYNIVTIKCSDTSKYEPLFTDYQIEKTDKLITAYDTFSKDSIGVCRSFCYKGSYVTDIPQLYNELFG